MATKTAIDALLEAIEQEADDRTPRIVAVSNEDTGEKGYFHLIGRNMYWASINQVFPGARIERRLRSGHYIDNDSRARYAATVKQIPNGTNNPKYPVIIVQSFIVSGGVVTNVLKEILLSTCDKIFSWKNASYKVMREDTMPLSDPSFLEFYKALLIPPAAAIQAVNKRNEVVSKAVRATFPFTTPEEIFTTIKMEQAPNVDISSVSKDEGAIIESTIDFESMESILIRTGMPEIVFMKNLTSLYNKGMIRLYTLRNENVEDVVARYRSNPSLNIDAMPVTTTVPKVHRPEPTPAPTISITPPIQNPNTARPPGRPVRPGGR